MPVDTIAVLFLAMSAGIGPAAGTPATQPAGLAACTAPAKAAPAGGNHVSSLMSPMIGAMMSGLMSSDSPSSVPPPAATHQNDKPPGTRPAGSSINAPAARPGG